MGTRGKDRLSEEQKRQVPCPRCGAATGEACSKGWYPGRAEPMEGASGKTRAHFERAAVATEVLSEQGTVSALGGDVIEDHEVDEAAREFLRAAKRLSEAVEL